MTILKIEVARPELGGFDLANDCGVALEPGKSCTLKVIFTPTEAGEWTANIIIDEDAADGPHKVQLKGVGILPGREVGKPVDRR